MTNAIQTPATDAVFAPTVKMHHATRAKAAKLAAMLAAEYPAIEIRVVDGESVDHETYAVECGGWEGVVVATDEVFWDGDKVPELADLLDAAQEAEIDPEAGAEEEEADEPTPASVVDPAYRAQYAEVSSNGQGNGDWLHETLVGYCASTTGFDPEVLTGVLLANGINPEMTGWGTNRSRGWQGRFRMSGRIVLEKAIAITGEFQLGDATYSATHDDAGFVAFLTTMQTKHAKAIAKAAKAAAKADAQIAAEVAKFQSEIETPDAE